MRSHIHLPERSLQQGFSLIELMIAMVLGFIVIAGLISVLVSTQRAYHVQESNNFSQQTVRFALDRMGYGLRMADFWGGTRAIRSINRVRSPA